MGCGGAGGRWVRWGGLEGGHAQALGVTGVGTDAGVKMAAFEAVGSGLCRLPWATVSDPGRVAPLFPAIKARPRPRPRRAARDAPRAAPKRLLLTPRRRRRRMI